MSSLAELKRRWSDGIHQAGEGKEGLKIQADSVVIAQITYQSLFKLYPKLSGMTGTAKTEDKEFLKVFQTPVIEVPTNLPNIRNDLPIQAFAVVCVVYCLTARGKWEYVRQEVEYMFRQGHPVLVGTTGLSCFSSYGGEESKIQDKVAMSSIGETQNKCGRGVQSRGWQRSHWGGCERRNWYLCCGIGTTISLCSICITYGGGGP